MNKKSTAIAFGILLLGFIILVVMSISASSKSDLQNEKLTGEISAMKNSLQSLQRSVDSLKTQAPGLGEYMTTIQLHTAKLWFAAKSNNWGLARYEFDELAETIEVVESLHIIHDKIDLSAVIASIRNGQLSQLDEAITKHDAVKFKESYTQTLSACNGCHMATMHEYIHIIPPTHEPVVNQSWEIIK